MIENDNDRVHQRITEWIQSPRADKYDECSNSLCSSDPSLLRDTPAGVFCVEHYSRLLSCEICGKGGTKVHRKKDVARRGQIICRECYCEDISDEYKDYQKSHNYSIGCGLSFDIRDGAKEVDGGE